MYIFLYKIYLILYRTLFCALSICIFIINSLYTFLDTLVTFEKFNSTRFKRSLVPKASTKISVFKLCHVQHILKFAYDLLRQIRRSESRLKRELLGRERG